MKSAKWMISYVVVAALGIGLAFTVVSKFMTPARSQDVPPAAIEAGVPSAVEGGVPAGVPMPPAEATQFADEYVAPQEVLQLDNYVYDPQGKRDPFKPFRVFKAGAKEVTDPLQKLPLEQFEVVGILWEVKTPRAMVRAPDGMVYVVVKNTKIGNSEGYVAAIREGELVVIETQHDEGHPVKHPRTMSLKK